MRNLIKLLLVLFSAGMIAACSSSDNLAKPAPLLKFDAQAKLHKDWGRNTGTIGKSYLNIQIGHTKQAVYVVNGKGQVQAYSADNGHKLWSTSLKTTISSGVSVAHKVVIVTDKNGVVYALSAQDGHKLWSHRLDAIVLAPAAISNQAAFLKTINDTVYALNIKTGKSEWSDTGNPPALVLRGGAKPRLFANYVAFGTASGQVQVYNQSNGNKIWQQQIAEPTGSFDVQRMVDVTVSPIIDQDTLYATAYQGNLAAYSLKNGELLWQNKLSSYTGMQTDDSHLFITDADSNVYSYNKADGSVNWKLTDLAARRITAPALLNNWIVVADAEGYVHVLDKTSGHMVARRRATTAVIRSAPVVIGNQVFVIDTLGHLFAYRLDK